MQQEGDKAIAKALEAKRLATEEEAKKAVAAKAAAEQSISANAGVEPSVINSTDCRFTSSHSNPGSILVLVNKKYCIQPVSFVPSRLVTIYNATLVPEAAEAFSAMYEAAQVAGQPFSVTSSYRSYELQASTYAYWVSVSGSQGADTYSARPGYSEHQTGLAVDVAAPGCVLNCFGGTSQYTWFQNNAASYGFIQRYYAGKEAITGYNAEEWHYRYVGVETAQAMKNANITTLEEYWGIAGGGY